MEVIAANRPPVIDPATLVTVTGQEVTGTVAADDPDGDTVTHARGIPPRSGTALVAADGRSPTCRGAASPAWTASP